jgi:hypothetical protein
MIWNEQILFIHAPKTGGMSLTHYLSDHLPDGRVTEKRHETLAEARAELANEGRRLEDFEKVFVVMRDPYTLEISRFNYLRLGHPWDVGKAQEVALHGDFKRYLAEAPFFGYFPPQLDLYYHENGSTPANLVVLRYERLNEEVEKHIAPFCREGADVPLPRLNVTAKACFEDYYDAEAEELCFQRHRWFFDEGFYERKDCAAGAEAADSRAGSARKLLSLWFHSMPIAMAADLLFVMP